MPTVVPFSRARAMAFPQEFQHEQPAPADAGSGARWSALMAQAQDGDRHAYHTLLQEIAPYLRAICRRHLGQGDDIEDAVQEILLVVHSIRHTYERGRPFKPWLSTIASRRIIDMLRRRSRRLRHEIESDGKVQIEDQAATHPDTEPDHVAARTLTAREVRQAVADLPARQREAIVLLRLQELTLGEAADVSKQSAGALKVACHRALKSLQSVFRDRD